MKHRHAVDRAEPLWSALRVSFVLALLGLPAIASDSPEAIRLPDTRRFPEAVASASNGTLFVSSIADGGVLGIDGGGAVTTAVLKPGDHVTRSTFAPQILKLKPGAAEFDVFVENDALEKGLDGIAMGRDGNLYVDTFPSAELFRLDVWDGTAGPVTKLETTRSLRFPDGLRAFRDGFLMVEGSGARSRITVSGERATLDPIGQFAGPTGVTVAGDGISVAKGQLGLHFGAATDGGAAPSSHLRSVAAN